MHTPLKTAELARVVGGRVQGDPSAVVGRVVTDTRAPMREHDVFFALRGPRFDGHDLLHRVWASGARVAVVDRDVPREAGQTVVRVDSVLDALQALAAWHRAAFQGCVVAITGSNGKTITRELLARMLTPHLRVAASPMSWNSQVGVPLALLGMASDADVYLVECGVSRPGEMRRLRAMVQPDVGVFTTVGGAHHEGFGSRETTASEKALLFEGLGPQTVYAPDDDPRIATVLAERRVSVAMNERVPDVPAVDLDLFRSVEVLRRDLWLAVAVAARFGVTALESLAAVDGWRPSEMRLETVQTPRGILLINDAYTADPESVAAALGVLARERSTGRRWAVLGDMIELGDRSMQAHEDAGRLAATLGIEALVGVGKAARHAAHAALAAGMDEALVHACADVDAAALVLDRVLRAGDVVLLKASRPVALERVADILFAGLSPTRVLVDLDAMADNVGQFRAHMGSGVSIMAVLKASGYGLDAVRVARALEAIGVEHLAVAYADEGVQLREGGVGLPILVQFPREGEVHKLLRHALSVEVGTAEQLAWLQREALRAGRRVPIHLKVDTGMARSGFAASDVSHVLRDIDADAVDLVGVMTHFAAADAPEHDAFTREQIAAFRSAVECVRSAGHAPVWVHACNTAGAVRFAEAHHTMVRLGLGLYGYHEGREPWPQSPVLRMTTRVLLTRTVELGTPVGYLRDWVAERTTRVAVVAVGYADGYPRALSNRGWMAVAGVRCPVIGRVCMDVAFLDVTDVETVQADDEVVVFGSAPDEPRVEDLAALAGTIPHEFLTRLSPRVRRVFVGSHGYRRT
jgi:alanine racemase